MRFLVVSLSFLSVSVSLCLSQNYIGVVVGKDE